MSYPLRLPPELDAEARERCARLGISLNAFIAVALDAYLRSGGKSRAGQRIPASPKAARAGSGKPSPRPSAEPPIGLNGLPKYHEDPENFRNWHSPDMWPYVDPEFEARWEGVDEFDDAARVAMEIEYWSTRQRPAG